jgi:hypothetical protein
MKYYSDFDQALTEFRESGGAMLYDEPGWHVGDAVEITEMVNWDGDAKTLRDVTEYALEMGKLTGEEISRELAYWQENN